MDEIDTHQLFLNYDYNHPVGVVKVTGIAKKLYDDKHSYVLVPIYETTIDEKEPELILVGFSMVHKANLNLSALPD